MEASEFKSLFLPLHGKLYAVAWQLLGNQQGAEDLVQDTYMRLWTKRNQLAAVENHEAYALTILRRLFYDEGRKKRIVEIQSDVNDLTAGLPTKTDNAFENADEMRFVFQLLDTLPAAQKQVIIMRDVEDKTYDEICQETGMTAVNVRSVLSRARRKVMKGFKAIKR